MPWVPFAIALVCLVGVGVLLYPAGAAWLTQYEQSQLIEKLSHEVEDLGPEERSAAIEQAAIYNQTITGGASVAENERLPQAIDQSPAAFDYNGLLRADASGLIGRIKIPAIQTDLPIYHGTSEHTLRQGVGHLEGTALPVGGSGSHSVLTGHRGLAGAELFTNLDQVDVGDTFTLEVFGEVLTYRVIETQVVEPDEREELYPRRGQDLVTLVTCTPLGVNSHRILVTGERIEPTPIEDIDAAGNPPDVPGFPWWAVLFGGVIVVLGGYVYISGRPAKRRPQHKQDHAADAEPQPVLAGASAER